MANNQRRNNMGDTFTHSVYMTLRTTRSAMKIVKLFKARGWSWRNCAWDEYEITAENIAELVIASKNPILISGGVAPYPDAITHIEAILETAGIDFEYDLYDENDQLIRSWPDTSPQNRNEE